MSYLPGIMAEVLGENPVAQIRLAIALASHSAEYAILEEIEKYRPGFIRLWNSDDEYRKVLSALSKNDQIALALVLLGNIAATHLNE